MKKFLFKLYKYSKLGFSEMYLKQGNLAYKIYI